MKGALVFTLHWSSWVAFRLHYLMYTTRDISSNVYLNHGYFEVKLVISEVAVVFLKMTSSIFYQRAASGFKSVARKPPHT